MTLANQHICQVLKQFASCVDVPHVHISQLTLSDRSAIESRASAATVRAAAALQSLTGCTVQTSFANMRVESLHDTLQMLESLPRQVTVVYLTVEGEISSQMMLIMPQTTANVVMHALDPDAAMEGATEDALGEVGNIVLNTFLNELLDGTMINADPSTPLIGTSDLSAMLELPLARAASDEDVVISFETTMSITTSDSNYRAPFHLLFLPAPGSLMRIVNGIEQQERVSPLRIPVRMGEMSVSARSGDVLVANALGSCVAIAMVDRLARVAALAHVMLPASPTRWSLAGKPTYAARYADTAIPALVEALERAGGRRVSARVYLAGGGQMFRGDLAQRMDVNLRNIGAVRESLERLRIPVYAEHTGGTISRALEVDVQSGAVVCKLERGDRYVLDNAA